MLGGKASLLSAATSGRNVSPFLAQNGRLAHRDRV
jgi:hypothetical protein